MKKKNYTIFGYSGFLGTEFQNFLKKKKIKYTLNKKNSFPKKLDRAIYFVGSDNWKNNSLKSMDANLLHLTKFLKNIESLNSFTFISSTRIYLNSRKNKIKENDLLSLNSNLEYLFNIQKILSENLLLNNLKNVKIIRLSNVYGANYQKNTLIPILINNALKYKKIYLSINSNSSKDYISIGDAMKNIYSISEQKKRGIFNLGSGKNTKLKDIANKIKKFTNCEITYSKKTYKEQFPKINLEKTKKIIKLKIKNDIIKDLPFLIENFRDNIKGLK